MISLVVPIYRNSENIPSLLVALSELRHRLREPLEVVFVVDGSPDDSYLQLESALPGTPFRSQLALLSRNFGSFSAIRAGLALGEGERFAVMAADLQEPPELIIEFCERMARGVDVVVGQRIGRDDPLGSRTMSSIYWWFYRRVVQPEVPEGGIDIFGCTRKVRDQILLLAERNSSLVGLLLWIGFRREEVAYVRRSRTLGKSAWTLKKKLRYLSDSIFNFTDLPIRVLTSVGLVGLLITIGFGFLVALMRLSGEIVVPGYAATVLMVMFFGALNCFGIGVVGGYVWRTFENSKGRPSYIVSAQRTFLGGTGAEPELTQTAGSGICGEP